MGEPKPPQLELLAAGEAAASGVTIDVKPNERAPSGGPLAAAYLLDAKANGGKISAEAALTIMRSAGLVEPEPPEPDFDWSAKHEAVILTEQLALAVYVNREGDAVIRRRQEAYFEEDDAIVVVLYENLPKVIAALTKIAKAPKQQPE